MPRTARMSTTTIEVWKADRDRLRDLADLLTEHGPGGRFGQAETVKWLLDQRDRELAAELDTPGEDQ